MVVMAGYDIHFQPVPAGSVKGFKCFEFGFEAALKVKGPQALINRWVKTLMTPRGSDPLYPSEGTAFGNLVGANITDIDTDVQDMVYLSVEDANEQVRRQDIDGLYPDNERLLSAEIIDYQANADGIEVYVRIKNMAEEAVTFRLVTL